MIKIKQRFNDSPGQALVEFALIISVLLMMIFLIIESARILWAWNTVQNAAREGARYAITGQEEGPTCPVDFGLPKFTTVDRDVCSDLRAASIINRTHRGLSGLPLNEESVIFEDDNYYNIEIWGVDESSQLRYDFGGIPSNPVIVRVTYRVPIITPVFSAILPSIPVVGQETLNNETFGQLGGASSSEGAALPPNLPPVPTPGVTPSPTPSPTPSNTPTPGPSNTPTYTATPLRCNIQFDGSVVAGDNAVFITGDVGITVTIINLTTGDTLGSATLDGPFFEGDDLRYACPGFATIPINPALTAANVGNVLLAEQTGVEGNNDNTIVLGVPPTATLPPTQTPVPTVTPSNTPLPTLTPTPSGPYITISPPSCGPGPNIGFVLQAFNWPTDQSVTFFWEGDSQGTFQAGHTGTFTLGWSFSGLSSGTYTASARSGLNGATATAIYTVPCPGQPTPTGAPTSTPAPADLVAIGPPTLLSTPPIVAYQPVQFSVNITNTGNIPVENQFFVDLYLDPTTILTDRIPLAESDGYSAVNSLGGGESQTVIVNAPFGFANSPTNHQVYGMVDSVLQISEINETNNVTDPRTVLNVTPAATPTPTPNLTGDSELSGLVQALIGIYLPQFRAEVFLTDESTSLIVARTSTDENGFYIFDTVPPGTYTLHACIVINNIEYYGLRTGRTPPNPYVDIYAAQGVCP